MRPILMGLMIWGVLCVTPLACATANANLPVMGNLFGGPFRLIDQTGNVRTNLDFKGQFMLITFGYTFCPDICPTDLATMATALDLLGGQSDKVQPIFITIDPERDTPSHLKDYVAAFYPRLIGLSGSNVEIQQVAKAYRVHRSKIINPAKPSDEYLVNHSSLTYLMGKDGEFLSMFPYGTKPEFMAQAIAKYLN
jgi:cytochrome oxidase Cu insertion factor (SCO1/SenC/PrrC family)